MLSHNENNNEEKKTLINYDSLKACALSTVTLHPLRVGLNCASTTMTPLETIKAIKPVFFKGIHYNLIRGITATGCQSVAKDLVQGMFGSHSKVSSLLSALIAGPAGLPATIFEVYFMRHNAIHSQMKNLAFHPTAISKWMYNRNLLMLFSCREVLFTFTAFGSEKMNQNQRIATYIVATYLTSAAHKFATIEATKDIFQLSAKVPNWSEGIYKGFYKIIHNQYQLPTLRGPIENPKNVSQGIANLLSATCHPNMFLWRFSYLYVFTNLYSQLRKQFENNKNTRMGLFQTSAHQKPSDLNGVVENMKHFRKAGQ